MSGPFGSSQWMHSSGAAVEGQSLRFNDNDSAYLSWTPLTAGTLTKFTFSAWVKRGNLSSSISDIKAIVGTNNGGSNFRDVLRFTDDNGTDILSFQHTAFSSYTLYTSAVFRDVSAWYHIVLAVDTTQATASDRVNIYVNGEAQTLNGTYPPQNNNTQFGRNCNQYIGARSSDGSSVIDYFDGYISEVNFIDGTQLDPTSFGETDANGQWVPIKNPSVTYGTNGFYLTFDGFNGSTASDESGNSNDWTANNLATTDLMLDHAQNNFATMNPLASSSTLSEGNLRSQYSGSGTYQSAASTMSISSGKWYVELRVTVANTFYPGFGIADITTEVASNPNHTSYLGLTSNGIAYYTNNGFFTNNAIDQSSTVTVSSGDIIGIAIDLDSAQNTYKIYQNGTLAETYNINAPANAYAFCESTLGTASAARADWNFGQDSSFHGLETAQGYQDANGVGDFYYEPPSGYLALCTQNLPDPAIADGTDHFNTVLYTGDGTSNRTISGVGFQPDLTWLKGRSTAVNHRIADSLRQYSSGAYYLLSSNLTAAEVATSDFSAFTSDGFTISDAAYDINDNTTTYAAWNWKANGSGVSNTNGSITSTVSANTTAGFSIVAYTGNGSAGATVGHGLTSTPEMVFLKDRSGSDHWRVYSSETGGTKSLYLSLSIAAATDSTIWNNTNPTSSVFTIGNDSGVNTSSNNYIAYCFHSVEGYSKLGSYTGNGSTDGPFVYTGFRPSFVLVKATGTASSWFMWDVQRNTYNAATTPLFANVSYAEEATLYPIDFLSNGFKLRASSGYGTNESAAYIYMAFAENPFKYSNAR